MAALSTSAKRDTTASDYQTKVVKNASTVYAGGLVAIEGATGRIVPWSDTAGLGTPGLCDGASEGGESALGTAGSVLAKVNYSGPILQRISVATVASEANVGERVYATSDNDFTLVATANVKTVGYITKYHATTVCDVKLFTPGEYEGL